MERLPRKKKKKLRKIGYGLKACTITVKGPFTDTRMSEDTEAEMAGAYLAISGLMGANDYGNPVN